MLKIKFNKNQINTFKRLGIEIIYLFGSRAGGRPGPLSDVDIGVVFRDPKKYKDNQLKPYYKLYDIFTSVLPKDYLRKRVALRAHEIDIVFLQFAPISLQFDAIVKNSILYQSDKEAAFCYQERVLREYLDFKYYLNIFQEATLARI